MPRFSILQPLPGLLILLFLAGLALRCPRLDQRPMHNDEAVNAIKFGRLWERGAYKYDPNEHHGPTLYYSTLAVARLTSSPDFAHLTETKLRLITVGFGAGLILLLAFIGDGLGQLGTRWAALFTAISPAMVFYSRYYIHEMLLIFFTLLALAAGWRYWRSRALGWALLTGVALGLMHATKETFVINLAAAFLALAVNQTWNRLFDASGLPLHAPRLNPWHLVAAFLLWIFVATLLFTSFFANPNGLVDSVRTYVPWLNRAGGASEHINPWSFYFHRLLWFHPAKGPVWTEALIVILAIIGTVASFRRQYLGHANASFARFLALYAFSVTAAYTLIGYKTPWCLLNFWLGIILLAGLGAAVLMRSAARRGTKLAWALLLFAGTIHLAWENYELSIPLAADQRNPYVYSQTSPDVVTVSRQLQELSEAYPSTNNLLIKVMAPQDDYWPLPWYLRRYKNVGWWSEIPNDPFASVMLVSARFHAALDEQKSHLMTRYFTLRPQVFFEFYVETNLWRSYLAKRPPPPPDD